MKTRAAFVRGTGRDWEIDELDLDEPKANEVLIRYVATGLCHSDEHLRTEGFWGGEARFPMVGGHEGSGVVEAVGPGVTRVAPGDHVVCSFLPSCGHCRWCSTGQQRLCDVGADVMSGNLPDGTFRFHLGDLDLGGLCMLGTFTQYGVVSEYSCVKIHPDIPLDVAALVGCGVPTGWGSSVYGAGVRAGDTVVIYGVGGVGINAVQGAVYAGAKNVVAVDPVAFKRDTAARLGATHVVSDHEEARALIVDGLTLGVGADHAVITMGVVTEEVVTAAVDTIRKGGDVTITGLGGVNDRNIHLPSAALTLFEKTIKGSLFGSGNPMYDIPKTLDLYQAGRIELDSLITNRYKLDEVNQAYADIEAGKNIRAMIIH